MEAAVAKKLWLAWQIRAMKAEAALRGLRDGLAGDTSTLAWWVTKECNTALLEAERYGTDSDQGTSPVEVAHP